MTTLLTLIITLTGILGLCLIALINSCNNISVLISAMLIFSFVIGISWIVYQIVKNKTEN